MLDRINHKRVSALLINYAGRPSSPTSFMLDNGLASLAARIKESGHEVKILDYSTISMMRKLIPEKFQVKLSRIFNSFKELSGKKVLTAGDKAKKAINFLELQMIDWQLAGVRKKIENEIFKEIKEEILDKEVNFLGFKVWNGDGFSGAVRIADLLRAEFPRLFMAAGGPQVKFFQKGIFSETNSFDALAVRDGENTILPLTEAALGRPLSEVPNIYYLLDGKPSFTYKKEITDMDSLPMPDYHPETYPAVLGDEKITSIVMVEDRRGCDGGCYFCVHPGISGTVSRSKSYGRVVDEFQYILNEYGFSNIRLAGSSSTGRSLRGIAEEKNKRRNLSGVNWTAFARIKDSNPEDFLFLKEAGLYSLFFGIESGSQKVLDGMNKRVKVEEIRRVILAAKKAEIFTAGSIIYQSPFDDQETRKETVALIDEIDPDSVPLQFMGIYPRTPYARDPEKFNFEIVYPSRVSNWLYHLGLKKKPTYYDPEIQSYLMNYKIRLLFPPEFWRPLPWKINGLSYKKYAAETQSLYKEFTDKGRLCMLTDEEALMAHLAGYSSGEFRSKTFEYIFTGNWEGMREVLMKVNHGKNWAGSVRG